MSHLVVSHFTVDLIHLSLYAQFGGLHGFAEHKSPYAFYLPLLLVTMCPFLDNTLSEVCFTPFIVFDSFFSPIFVIPFDCFVLILNLLFFPFSRPVDHAEGR